MCKNVCDNLAFVALFGRSLFFCRFLQTNDHFVEETSPPFLLPNHFERRCPMSNVSELCRVVHLVCFFLFAFFVVLRFNKPLTCDHNVCTL